MTKAEVIEVLHSIECKYSEIRKHDREFEAIETAIELLKKSGTKALNQHLIHQPQAS